MNHKGQLLLEYSRLYPCFDSYDYANEDRFHRNYWLCKDEQELMIKYEYITAMMIILLARCLLFWGLPYSMMMEQVL